MPKHAAIRRPKPAHVPHSRQRTVNRAPSPKWIADWRDRISTSQLINRLNTFALADPDDPTSPRMTRTQAQVALSLLRKVLPDMQSIELKGNADAPITVQVLRFADALDDSLPALTAMQNGTQNGVQNRTSIMPREPGEPLTIDITPRLIDDPPDPLDQPRSPRRTRGRKRSQ